MSQSIFGLTMLNCFGPCDGDTAHQCMRRAALCSRLAKRVRGQARTQLYRHKNANIRAACKYSSTLVEVRADHDRYFGLLSVREKRPDGVRVHTHENWIDVAYTY